MSKTILTILIVLLIVIGIGWWATKGETPTTGTTDEMNNSTGEVSVTTSPASDNSAVTAPSVKSFTIKGSNFAFDPKTITVKRGDTVRINFVNAGGVHDWKLDEFQASTKQLRDGEQETIEFLADRAGSFEYYCSVGTHRQMGMVGTLIVTE